MTTSTPVPPMAPSKLVRPARKKSAAKAPAAEAAAPAQLVSEPAQKQVVPAKAAKKPVAKTKADKPVKAMKAVKSAPVTTAPAKAAKVKMVRDSFTMPAGEYAQLAELKQRALKSAHPVKKSELLRAGIRLLADQSDEALMTILRAVPAIKPGRPKNAGKKG